MNSVDERVASLERRVTMLILLTATLVVISLAVLVRFGLRQGPLDAVTARAFFLVDEKGETVAKWVQHPTAGPVLILTASEVGGEVMVGSFGPDAGISVVGRDRSVATLALGRNGGPSVSLSDESRRAWLSLGDTGSPIVFLKDKDGHVVVAPSHIDMKDSAGREIFRAGPAHTER